MKTNKNININVSEELKIKIQEWDKEGRFYGVFPIKGNSMESNDKNKNIPDGSKVLVSDTDFKPNPNLIANFGLIPTNQPIVLHLKKTDDERFLCKTVAFQDGITNRLLMRSNNPEVPDFWVNIKYVQRVFKVQKVIEN